LAADLDFHFNHNARAAVANCMAGNLSVRRERALEVGGFDENFVGVAYRFETDFCRRLRARGGSILFEPAASVRHLKAPRGGIRVHGNHLTSSSPAHGVGDYYFALRHGSPGESLPYILQRPFREVCTRFHLGHPWWIPAKLTGEVRAFLWAVRLARAGPRFAARE
jgi:GT2 family glycosyltransferase